MKDTDTVATWEDQARLLRIMAHPVRLIILNALCERPQCVGDLNSLVPIVQAHLSQHMAALRKAGLVDCHICGPLRCYYIIRPTLVKKLIRALSENHPLRLRDHRSVIRAVKRYEAQKVEAKNAAASSSTRRRSVKE